MQFQLNDHMHGFTVTHIYPLSDWNGTLIQMVHTKSGAQLCYFDRKDENKTFGIAFKTTPENDTGVFHMLEHSVLNGSSKYPVKEPFVELLKSSMQTFLNAMTYSDKTLYPVSSRSEKDFMNLTSVYLDAVFHPAIYSTPNIFYQEGWHYEIEEEKDIPTYNGVVLNEMKGAFSSVDTLLQNSITRQLFRNCYQYVSGGDPSHITDLTYEEFINTHKKYYHPSNAHIWLEGTMDIDKMLEFIDTEYLSHYENSNTHFDIPMQDKLPASQVTIPYEISNDQPEEEQCHICYSNIVSTFDNVEKNLAYSILSNVLTSSNESPLIKPFLDAKLAQDVEFDILDGIQQPIAVITFRNTEKEREESIRNLLHSTITDLVEKGIDHDAVQACINQAEFSYRESHEPTGIYHIEDALNAWLYQEDPTPYLSLSSVFTSLRDKVGEGYFESLLKDFLLDEEHIQTTIAVPDKTIATKQAEEEKEKLQKIKASWNNVEDYISLNKDLKQWQTTPNSLEQLSTLPTLEKEDIPPLKDPCLPEPQEVNGVPVLSYDVETNGIAYINYYFNASGIQTDLLSPLSFFVSLLADIPTQNYDVPSLHAAIQKDIGNLTITTLSESPIGEKGKTMPLIAVRVSSLYDNVDNSHAIVKEILQNSLFTKENIYPILKQKVASSKQMIINYGHLIATVRVNAHYQANSVFSEFTSGYSYHKFLLDLEEHYDEKIDDFLELCHLFLENLFVKSRLTLSVTQPQLEKASSFIQDFPLGDGYANSYMHYPFLKEKKEAILIPGGVCYSAICTPIEKEEPTYDLLCHLLTYDWLWNEVRVKGGAYGTGIRSTNSGGFMAYSYRDPDPKNLVHALENTKDYAEHLDSSFPLTQYLIGTVGSLTPLLSIGSRINLWNAKYFSKVTFDISKQRREALLATTLEDIQKGASLLTDSLENSYQCVVGPQNILDTLEGFKIVK